MVLHDLRPTKEKHKSSRVTSLQSSNVIRNMIRISISEICYLRHLFSENVFVDRIYADMKIKCLAPKKNSFDIGMKEAYTMTRWIEDGVFEAISKKYLASAELCIYASSPSTKLLESYNYKVSYGNEGVISMKAGFNAEKEVEFDATDVKSQAVHLIRALISITNSLAPLPSDRLVTMRLVFNALCPPDWVPPFFELDKEILPKTFDEKSLRVAIGTVFTEHHTVRMKLDALESSFEPSEEDQSPEKPNIIPEETSPECSPSGSDTDIFESQTDNELSQMPISHAPTDNSMSIRSFINTICKLEKFDYRILLKVFPDLSISKYEEMITKFINDKAIETVSNDCRYVRSIAQNEDVFLDAVNVIHGAMRKTISLRNLSDAIEISILAADSILCRMQTMDMVKQIGSSNYGRYNVLYKGFNHTLACKAAKRAETKRSEVAEKYAAYSKSTREAGTTLSQQSSGCKVYGISLPIIQQHRISSKRKIALSSLDAASKKKK